MKGPRWGRKESSDEQTNFDGHVQCRCELFYLTSKAVFVLFNVHRQGFQTDEAFTGNE